MDNTQLDVYLDLDRIPRPVGQAWFTQRRGGPVTSIAGSTTPDDEQAGLVSLAEQCRLKPAQAQQIRTEVAQAAATWPDAANNRGIKPAEIARFEDTFNTSALR